MGRPERNFEYRPPEEPLDPRHFYAAYVFDQPETHKHDVITLVEEAYRLKYPVRYWWLSEAMDLQDAPDRLIVCVHHPHNDENAGMDLYQALQERRAVWDELDSATVEEYRELSKPITGPQGVCWPDGRALFPLEKEYSVFYSLSGLMVVAALNETEASETVFATLATLIGKSRTQGISAQEAAEVQLTDAEVEIDAVQEVQNWSVEIKVRPIPNNVWIECFESEETGHLCNAIYVAEGIDEQGQLYQRREWNLGAYAPKGFAPQDWEPAFTVQRGHDLARVLEHLETLRDDGTLSAEDFARSEAFYHRLFPQPPPHS